MAEGRDEGELCGNCRLPEDKHRGDLDKVAVFLALVGCPGFAVPRRRAAPAGQPGSRRLCTRCLQSGHSQAGCTN